MTSSTRRRVLPLLAALLLTRALPAQAAPDTAAIGQATSAAVAWLALIDEGRFDASWEAAAPAFQQAVTRPEWTTALTRARGPFEPFGARTLEGARYSETLPNAPPGPYVVMQYRTQVAGDRMVIETVVPMRVADGTWRVSGYFVRPVN